jgi:hypothetical protein
MTGRKRRLQPDDARGVGLEAGHEGVTDELHVRGDVLLARKRSDGMPHPRCGLSRSCKSQPYLRAFTM